MIDHKHSGEHRSSRILQRMNSASERFRSWLISRVPLPFLTHAYEIFLAFALQLIGLGLLLGEVDPQSVAGQVPDAIRNLWAWFVFGGASFTLHGIFMHRPRMEWAGQMLLGWGTFFYSMAIFSSINIRQGGIAGFVFFSLAAVGWWRAFKITSAPQVQKRLLLETSKQKRQIQKNRYGGLGR